MPAILGLVSRTSEPPLAESRLRAAVGCAPCWNNQTCVHKRVPRAVFVSSDAKAIAPMDQDGACADQDHNGPHPEGAGNDTERSWVVLDALGDQAGRLCHVLGAQRPSEHAPRARRAAQILRGDFAFAVWRPAAGELLLVRDAMGVRPLYYSIQDAVVSFSTDLNAIRRGLMEDEKVNPRVIAHHLCGQPGPTGETFWSEVRAVPAGGYTVVDVPSGAAASGQWWSLTAEAIEHETDVERVAARIRHLFLRSIEDRFSPAEVPGSFLSGGLDSSSIVGGLRANLRGDAQTLHTFSFWFPGLPKAERRRSDETRYQESVARYTSATPHRIPADRISPLGQLDDLLLALGEPSAAPNQYLHHAGLDLAASVGVDVIFDGIDGDSAIGHGMRRLWQLLARGSWLALLRESRALSRHIPARRQTTLRILKDHALPGALPAYWHRRRDLREREHGLQQRLSILSGALRQEPSVQASLRSQLHQNVDAYRCPRVDQIEGLRSPLFEGAVSALSRLAASKGLRITFPFFERRLVETAVSIPLEFKLAHGWTRYIFRLAMEGLIPEDVRWRISKADLSPRFYQGLLTTDRAFAESVLRKSEDRLEPYVDIDELRSLAHRLFSHEDRQVAPRVMSLVTLARWLELVDRRSV